MSDDEQDDGEDVELRRMDRTHRSRLKSGKRMREREREEEEEEQQIEIEAPPPLVPTAFVVDECVRHLSLDDVDEDWNGTCALCEFGVGKIPLHKNTIEYDLYNVIGRCRSAVPLETLCFIVSEFHKKRICAAYPSHRSGWSISSIKRHFLRCLEDPTYRLQNDQRRLRVATEKLFGMLFVQKKQRMEGEETSYDALETENAKLLLKFMEMEMKISSKLHGHNTT